MQEHAPWQVRERTETAKAGRRKILRELGHEQRKRACSRVQELRGGRKHWWETEDSVADQSFAALAALPWDV